MDPLTVWFQVPLREDGDKRLGAKPRTRRASKARPRAPTSPGPLHPAFRWKQLESRLTRLFGGWTRQPDVVGEWFDEEQGVPVRELSRLYWVDVPEERMPELEALLRSAVRDVHPEVHPDGRERSGPPDPGDEA